ncbi:MAG: hypothetical protein HY399_05455 [Elusimicrobia bacterium]|nr:hypothetical protein [Elusimicrobiota bacterium]
MKRRRFFRFLLAFVLLPTAFAALMATAKAFGMALKRPTGNVPFLIGFFTYPLFQWIFFRPLRVYIFGHELTHALAAWFSGLRVRRFSVSKTKGHVLLTGSNTFIALAPYCIPLYALFLIVLFFVMQWFTQLNSYGPYLHALVGFALAFHFFLTGDILWSKKQSDLSQAGGVFFSLMIIILSNCLVLGLALKLFFPHSFFLKSYGMEWWTGTLSFWKGCYALVQRN